MGYTIRTDTYRYTEWVGFNKCQDASCPDQLADWGTVCLGEYPIVAPVRGHRKWKL